MNLTFSLAEMSDAAEIAAISNLAADGLTARFGKGHWSYHCSERGVFGQKGKSQVFIAKEDGTIIGILKLVSQKPWAIDTAYFTTTANPVYLVGMAVRPDRQRMGIDTFMLKEVNAHAKLFPANSIRLDAYDNPVGAGDFYEKCGYTERGRVTYKSNPLIYYETLL